jgi:hypothetical protein
MIQITIDGITTTIDPARFGVELDADLARALAVELEDCATTALAKVRDHEWTPGHDCDGEWRLVEVWEAIRNDDWAERQIRKAARGDGGRH